MLHLFSVFCSILKEKLKGRELGILKICYGLVISPRYTCHLDAEVLASAGFLTWFGIMNTGSWNCHRESSIDGYQTRNLIEER